MTGDLDPRWQWVDIGTQADPNQWAKGRCNHLTPLPVTAAITGETVAHLCPDCDTQLPAEWQAQP